ncbi:MAG: phosphomethylpyrimidine synthase ThiC [Candidatus Hodarchaeota archaeon]
MTTIMELAKRGVITEEMRKIAEKEKMPVEHLRRRIANGRVVIVRNLVHENVNLVGIGEGMTTKINANIGTSEDVSDAAEEVEKAKVAVKYGSDTIMDLSTGGNIDQIRKMIVQATDVPIGTVPIYQAAIEALDKSGAIVEMNENDMFNAIEKHAKDGIDFVTVHCGVTKRIIEHLVLHPRLINMVSRGGTFHAAWILHNERENPLYANFDYLLELAKEYDLTLSLGDGLRPGCIKDATDWAQIEELLTISDLVKRSRNANVQTMVEGPGHIPLNQIRVNVELQKTLCNGAPFYVLGPLVTDIALGYDHIVAAIGGALAGLAGADFLCYVTPSEHLGLPTIEDVREGVIAAKIAAHAVDIAKRGEAFMERDMAISKARANLDWEKVIRLALDPEKAGEIYKRKNISEQETCTMCGSYCALKILGKYLKSSKIKEGVC